MKVTKGDLIIYSKPFAYNLLNRYRGMRCETCLDSNPTLKKCSKCKRAAYCNKECQTSGWIDHKHECGYFGRSHSPQTVAVERLSLMDFAILLARIYHKLRMGGADQNETIGNVTKSFANLTSHSETIRKDNEKLICIRGVSVILGMFLGTKMIPFDQVLDIAGKMLINTIRIKDEINDKIIGTGLYLGLSALNHSCHPNAYYVFVGPDLIVRSTEEHEDFDVSKVFIAYIDVLFLKEIRRQELLEQYCFVCNCSWCKDDAMDKQMISIRCDNVDCDAAVCIHNDKCEKCDTLVNPGKKIEAFALFEELRLACTNAKRLKQEESDFEREHARYYTALETLIDALKKAERLLHPLNIGYVQSAVETIFLNECTFYRSPMAVIRASRRPECRTYFLVALNGYRTYYGEANPNLAKLLLRIGRLQFFFGFREEGKRYIKEALDMFCIIFGEESKTTQNLRKHANFLS